MYSQPHMPSPKPEKALGTSASVVPGGTDITSYVTAILDTAADAIVTIDEDGIVLSFNRTAVQMFGYQTSELVGKNVSMLMPSPFREHHDMYLSRYLKTGKARIIGIGREVIGLRRDGAVFPMELAVSEVAGMGKRTFVGIIRDVSERKYLEKALVTASENERREIGRDLHDALGQIITGISLLAKSLAKRLDSVDKTLAAEADSIATLSMEAMAETKRLAYGAFPTELERQGLLAALTQMAETVRRVYHIDTFFTGPAHWEPLDRDTELHLYRITQESVANAIKHGKPGHLQMFLQRDREGITLIIIDDGMGMAATRDPKRVSMGLDIMRHRANLIGGTITLTSPKEGGTEVRCCIPKAFLVTKGV
jgi:two-component system sensor kinase FixL